MSAGTEESMGERPVALDVEEFSQVSAKQGIDGVGLLKLCCYVWFVPIRVLQKLVHAMNGNVAQSKAAASGMSDDPWADYLKQNGASKAKGSQREDRAKWEDDGSKACVLLVEDQLVAEGTPVSQIPATKVQHGTTGVAFVTMATLEILAKVRSPKPLALILPEARNHGPVFDALGLISSAMHSCILRIRDPVKDKTELRGVTLINLGAKAVVCRTHKPELTIPSEAQAVIIAETDSRYHTPDQSHQLQSNVRGTIIEWIRRSLPDSVAQDLTRFDFFAWGRVEGAHAVVQSVRFQVPASCVEAVLTESGLHAPLFFRLFTLKGEKPLHQHSLQWLQGKNLQEARVMALGTAGVAGIVVSKGGLGLRVTSKSVSEIRKALMPDGVPHGNITDANRGVMITGHWEVQGVPRSVKVDALIQGLVAWGWTTIPLKCWVQPGTNGLLTWLVGAEKAPPRQSHVALVVEAASKPAAVRKPRKSKPTLATTVGVVSAPPGLPAPMRGPTSSVAATVQHPQRDNSGIIHNLVDRMTKLEARQDKNEETAKQQSERIQGLQTSVDSNFAKLFAMISQGSQGVPSAEQDGKRHKPGQD